MKVSNSRQGQVAVVTFSHPPVNALSARAGLPQAILAELDALAADSSVRAIVLHGDGRCFSAGADIGDFQDDPEKDVAPLRLLMARLDAMTKPVVAAIHGLAFGGGLELALAAHARICTAEARIGLPEVTLGLLPGAGGTQRLPRLAGVKAALGIMLRGAPFDAAKALTAGIVDQIAASDLEGEAVALALSLADAGALPRASARSVAPDEEAIAAARAAIGKGPGSLQARQSIVDCVEAAAALPFEAGLATEYKAFDTLMLSDASRGLRHIFLGERTVAKIPNLPAEVKAAPLTSAAIVGAGTMGAGIATAILNAGLPVTLIEQKPEALERGVGYVHKTINADVAKGRITPEVAEARLAQLSSSLDMAALGAADIVIEAVFEDIEVKRQVFSAIDAAAKPGAILASNTSTLDLDAIAGFTRRPQDVVGAHFFSPANIMKLLEVVRGQHTSPQVLASTLAFAKTIGKVGVVAGVCDGFIGNRMFEEYLRQAYYLLEEGCSVQQVDGALERWGMAMGPLKVMDLAGQDIGWSIRKRRAIEQPDRPYSKIPDLVCELGRFGQKTGAGFYLYPEGGRTAVPDPDIDALIKAHVALIGAPQRQIGDDEIVARCVLALANEGARILGDGMAYRAVDIDVVYVDGYGFPAQRGGPMFYADTLGLPAVLRQMQSFQAGYQGWAWAPAPLMADLVGVGAAFESLNG